MKHTSSQKWLWILTGAALIVAFLAFLPRKHGSLPDQLAGVWTSADPRYADRSFELTQSTVAFGTGGQAVDLYLISDVEKAPQGDKTLYEIHCHRMKGAKEKISFFYTLQDGGTIRFKNQTHIVWTKKETPD